MTASRREPSVERPRLPLLLWLASAAFIVYGTTIPFRFVGDPQIVAEHLARVSLNPLISPDTGQRLSIPDFSANILLFMPFGCFGVWALSRPRSATARIVLLVILSFLLSSSVETAQLFTLDRTSSLGDVLANTIGGFSGAVAGVVLGATMSLFVGATAAAGLTDSLMLFPFVVATLVVLAGAWEPFDVTLDIGSVVPKLRMFLHDPLQAGAPSDEVLSFLQHLFFTSTFVLWLRELRIRSAATIAAIIGVVVAAGGEGFQLFIAARMPGLWDAAVGIAGALAGVPVGLSLDRSAFVEHGRSEDHQAHARERRWAWCFVLIVLTAVGVAMQQLSPFTFTVAASQPFQWFPFLNYYAATSSNTVSHSAELLLAYFPIGFGLALTIARGGPRLAAVTGIALAIAAPVEYLQRFIAGRYPDITDIALSVMGAWMGCWTATTGWRLFVEEMQLISRSSEAAISSHRPGLRDPASLSVPRSARPSPARRR